jgi:hypothetical protein
MVNNMMGREKRKAKRISYMCEIQFESYGMKQLSTRINDISVTGLFIDSTSCLAVGAILKMRFTVLGVALVVSGIVRNCMPQSGMGIEFIDLRPDQRELIERLVEGTAQNSSQFADASQAQNLHQENHISSMNEPGDTAVTEGQKILMGNFAIISLFDVIQMVENSKVTGALTIHMLDSIGDIYFNEGQIANARAGADIGVAALTKFLEVTQGSFEFKKTDREYSRVIQATSNTGLLLDLLATKDEEAALN